ncbi:MAG: CinA family protein [Rothia sp. (in: high G+C Gram-positive bacteria)]|nr:CinA family protein [Rothia sp. (in: high G+C Gram-positive bacteria)]
MGDLGQELERAAFELVETAKDAGVQLATAESLTGGMLGQLICTVAGASAVYKGGVISYASSVKAQVLGVSAELLEARGAVDPEVAQQMAAGAARVCGADIGIATTGAAGPEPWDSKPVGRVYLGVSSGGQVYSVQKDYTGDRTAIRQQAALDALYLAIQRIQTAR